MASPPLTDAIVQVVEYCVACRQLTGPVRYGPDESLCVRVKSLAPAPSDANKQWYQIRVTLICSSVLKCDVFQFLSGAECHLRTAVLHSQGLDDKSHLNITCPTSGSCQVYVRREGLALTRYDKEETARGINFRFRVFMGSAEMASSCEDVMTYLRQLQTMHAQIQIKGTIEVPGHVDEFSIKNRLPSRDKMAFLKVLTNPSHYTSLSLPDVDRVSLKCTCPHSLMALRLVDSGQDVHYRLTVLASVLPPPEGRLAAAAKCGTIKVLLFGPGGVPLLLPRHNQVNDEDMCSMFNLDEYGLQATVASPNDKESPLAHHWEYRVSDMYSDPTDASPSDREKPHTIHLFFVFDRWNPSAKCEVDTLLDMQQTLRLNVNHVLLSCRCKVRKAVSAALGKVLTSNDPDRQRRKKYESAVNVMSQSVCLITSRSTNADFRTQCMGLVNATDGRELHNELKTRLWSIAKEKAKVKSSEPNSRRHLVATFDGQGALRGSQSTQGSETTDTGSTVRARRGLQASQGKTVSLDLSSQVSTLETFASVLTSGSQSARDSTSNSGTSLEQPSTSTQSTQQSTSSGSQRLAFSSSQQSETVGDFSQSRSSSGARNPARKNLSIRNQTQPGSVTGSQRPASSERPTVISQTSQATVAKILAKLQKNPRVKVSPSQSTPQFRTGSMETQRLEASGGSSSSQFSVSSLQMMSDQSQPLIPTVVDNNNLASRKRQYDHGSSRSNPTAEAIAVSGYPACTSSARLDLRAAPVTQSTENSTSLSTTECEPLIPSVVESVRTSDDMRGSSQWQTVNPDRLPNAESIFLQTLLRENTNANSMPLLSNDRCQNQILFHSQGSQFGAIVPQNPVDEQPQRMPGSFPGYDSVRMAQALPTPSQSTQGSVEECVVPQTSQGATSGWQGWHCPTRVAGYSSEGAPGGHWYPHDAQGSQSYPISHGAPGRLGYPVSHGAPGSQEYFIRHGAPWSQSYPVSQNYASQGSYGSAEYGRSQGGVYANQNVVYGRMEDTINSSMASQNLEELLASCSSTGDDVSMFPEPKKRPHDSDEETDDQLMRELNNPKKRKIEEIDHSLANASHWLSDITDF